MAARDRSPEDRGPYVSIYVALIESPEYDALSRYGAAMLWALKVWPRAGLAGIFEVFPDQLARRSKVPARWVPGALRELEEGEWIRTEGRWVWLRNHLRFNPQFSPGNPKQAAALRFNVAGLPKIKLVCQFLAYYHALNYLPPGLECSALNSGSFSDPPPNTKTDAVPVTETETVAVPARVRGRSSAAAISASSAPTLDRNETRALIDAYNATFGSRILFTPGNLKAADRLYGAGYTLDQALEVFSAVKASQTPTAAWCHDNNREFEFLIRPEYRSHRSKELVPGMIDKVLNELGTGRRAERRAP